MKVQKWDQPQPTANIDQKGRLMFNKAGAEMLERIGVYEVVFLYHELKKNIVRLGIGAPAHGEVGVPIVTCRGYPRVQLPAALRRMLHIRPAMITQRTYPLTLCEGRNAQAWGRTVLTVDLVTSEEK